MWRRSKGILASNTRGGHNEKLLETQNEAPKDDLLMCHNFGKSAGIEHLHKDSENDTDDNILWARSESGFTNDRLTLSYIKHSNEYTKDGTKGLYRMLISASAKAGLIPFKPDIVLSKMRSHNGIQENAPPQPPHELSSSPGFMTPPPPWNEFNTPITQTQRKRGSGYVDLRIESGPWPQTLVVK